MQITNTNSSATVANVSLRLDSNGFTPSATNYADDWSVDAAKSTPGNDIFDGFHYVRYKYPVSVPPLSEPSQLLIANVLISGHQLVIPGVI